MALREIELLDMDSPSTVAPDPDLAFIIDAEQEAFRRWRPAVMVGDKVRPFIDSYFALHPNVPWAGLMLINGATVLDQGLVLNKGRLLCGYSLMYPPIVFPYAHSALKFTPSGAGRWSVDIPDNVVHLPGITASIVCDGWQIYGHWLVDVLPRLNRILESQRHIDTFLFPGPVTAWQTAMLKAVGIDFARCQFIDFSTTVVTCEQLVIATYDRFNSEIRPDLIKIHDRLRLAATVSQTPQRLIFLSRAPGSARSLSNRGAVEEAVARLGYEIVRPERLSFPEQIDLFSSARVILGECGSGMHNALLSGPGVRIGVIQSGINHNFLQAQIAMLKQQDIFYVIGPPDPHDETAFSVEPQDVRYVAQMMKEQ
jgi:hypothetical protein